MASKPDVNEMAGRFGVYGLVLLWLALWSAVVAWASGIGAAGVVRVVEVWVVHGWGTAVVLGAGWGLGWLLWSGLKRGERQGGLGTALTWVLVWLTGIGVWLWGVGLLGRLGLLLPAVVWGWTAVGWLGVVGWVVRAGKRRGAGPTRPGSLSWPGALVGRVACLGWLVPGVAVLMVAGAVAPGGLWAVDAFGYDVTSYKLQLPREWVSDGWIGGYTHNVYGYLPSLMEGGFAGVGLLMGSVESAAIACQGLHAAVAGLGALAVGACVCDIARKRDGLGGEWVGWAVGGVVMVVPWWVITGSQAGNDAAAVAFGSAGLAWGLRMTGWRGAVAVGFLWGCAVLAKPTAGPMLVGPGGLVLVGWWVVRWWKQRGEAGPTRPGSLGAVVGSIVLVGGVMVSAWLPWLVQNGVRTGNPVFPLAMGVFGSGHWEQAEVERWQRGHGSSASWDAGWGAALWRQGVVNRGYGAVGGEWVLDAGGEAAAFSVEGGVPVFWGLVLVMGGVGVVCGLMFGGEAGPTRPGSLVRPGSLGVWVLVMGGVVVLQLGVWGLATHWQSRFLLPVLVPAGVVLGLGLVGLGGDRVGRDRSRATGLNGGWLGWSVMGVGLAGLFWVSVTELRRQTVPEMVRVDSVGHEGLVPIAPGRLMGLLEGGEAESPLGAWRGPAGLEKVMVLGGNGGLFYVPSPVVYASAFDRNSWSVWWVEAGGEAGVGPAEVGRRMAERLRAAGVGRVWVAFGELIRLERTYGLDAGMEPDTVREVIRGWRVLGELGGGVVMEVTH